MFIDEGSEVTHRVQELLSQFIVKHLVFCRATNRVQAPRDGTHPKDMPLRLTIVVKRDRGEVVVDGG